MTVVRLLVSLARRPHRLFYETHVDEPLPLGETPPAVLGTGAFAGSDGRTTGGATLLRLPDGRRVLRLQNLATANGPELDVALAKASTLGSCRVSLGRLKGTHGSHTYPLPDDLQVDEFDAVVLWCRPLQVAFGVAPLSR